jgi:hypothetical protein
MKEVLVGIVLREGLEKSFYEAYDCFLECEGLNEGNKCLRVRNMLRQRKVDIVCLQDTKMEYISNSFVRNLWGCAYADWCFVSSRGASGGILLMRDKRLVTKLEVSVGEFVIACSFKNVEDDFVWAFMGVYGPNFDYIRCLIWEELAGLISWWDVLWCIGGDFNVTHFPSERLGGACLNAMTKFLDFISEQGLMDLLLAGGT